MSYPRDLDEYAESELRAELKRRKDLRNQGLCDYCCRNRNTKPCKFPNRHAEADIEAIRKELGGLREKIETTSDAYHEGVRTAVKKCVDCGVSLRDTASLLGISYQRVAQIRKELGI